MPETVHAEWVKSVTDRDQHELRTYQPRPGLMSRPSPVEGRVLGLVRFEWWKGPLTRTVQAVFRGPPEFSYSWQKGPNFDAPDMAPRDYRNDVPNLVEGFRLVEATFRERNPDVVLRVSGDAPQILRGT